MTLYGAVALAIPCTCREAPADPYDAAPRIAHCPEPLRSTPRPPAPGPSSGTPPVELPRTEEAARRADALARSLCAARERLAAPLACLAASLVRERSWCQFGFARAGDFARERLGRSGRWLRDLAALHEGLARLDGLAAALAGDDGGVPLGRRRALLVARVATDATLSSWIAQARQLTVRELQTAVAESRAVCVSAHAVSTPSPPASEPSPSHPSDGIDEDEDRSLVSLAAPRAVVAAFDEAVDLYRAVEGGEATVTSFVEALVAEASAAAGGHADDAPADDPPADGSPPDGCGPTADAAAISQCAFSSSADVHRSSPRRGPSPSLIERSLARSTDRWRHLPPSTDASWGLALGRSTLARLAAITRAGDSGTCAERVARMRELLGIEDDIEGHLGRLLATMGEQDAWNRLRFAGLAHYAQERLGLSRTAALSRARAARLAGRFPSLRSAYERNEIGLEATLLVGRILSIARPGAAHGFATEPRPVGGGSHAEQEWVRHAAEITFKRLRDEARALDRFRAFTIDTADGASLPAASPAAPALAVSSSPGAQLSDAEWHQSLRREQGTARRRVAALGFIALGARPAASGPFDPTTALIPEPDVFLRLTLPDDLADRFLDAIETARQDLTAEADAIPWDEDWPPPEAAESAAPGRLGSARASAPSDFDAASRYAAPSRLAARTFSIRARRLPSWVGLLALIEDFVATWDPDEPASGASDDPILARDGWRCLAPGCTSRANLELHHVIYRSRGGGDEAWNIVTLCRFHHQRGEHGDLARLVGRAPLDLIWRLGSTAVAPAPAASNEPPPDPSAATAAWYRNERHIAPPEPGAPEPIGPEPIAPEPETEDVPGNFSQAALTPM